ncbi:hypothetical protein EHS13_23075 [Paenibacillus psychroresistens]|uniref:Uncharacterized protein n=1 Tax=Paenibacillus psychroresistens TaxID=1778678 RepID=A0A6B8RPV4_9BACL|nr:hypothetical protein EHS13_23075 [Paenibacillus psychroresistens]
MANPLSSDHPHIYKKHMKVFLRKHKALRLGVISFSLGSAKREGNGLFKIASLSIKVAYIPTNGCSIATATKADQMFGLPIWQKLSFPNYSTCISQSG